MIQEDVVNGTFVVPFTANPGRVVVGFGDAAQLSFARAQDTSLRVIPALLNRTLATGATLMLQASNDLSFSGPVHVNNPSGIGGALTLQAGRSVALNSALSTDGGNLSVTANAPQASGVVNSQRDPGAATITMGKGSTIDATGATARFAVADGAGLSSNARGTIALTTVTAGTVQVAGAALTPAGPELVGSTTINGNLQLASDSGLLVDVIGAHAGEYDTVQVNGTVSLNGLLSFRVSGYTPQAGRVFTLIANDGSDPVQGSFKALAEGAALPVNGLLWHISYRGGDGNDVTLSMDSKLYLPLVQR
jgi:hypothetical protein